MLDESLRLEISAGEGLGLFTDRTPQRSTGVLAGADIISADNHYPLTEDIWYEAFPTHLKAKAPRVWWDEEAHIHQLGENFKTVFPPAGQLLIRSMEDHPATRDLKRRLQDLDAEGIEKEIMFPQAVALFFHWPDLEVRNYIFRTYNEHMADVQKRLGGRSFPVGIPNYWDPAEGPASIRAIRDLGLKAIMLPTTPGKKKDGTSVIYNTEEFDPFWAEIERSGLPICHHVGESFVQEGINGEGSRLMNELGPSLMRKNFGVYVFGRIFDKFPDLKVVFAEAGLNWIPGALQDAEMICNSHALLFQSMPDHRPSYYWHNNCYATFMSDPAGMRMLDIIGADRIMWSVDYPHNEGTFGYTQDSIRKVVDATGKEDALKIVGRTAQKVFNI
jgi:predicted TIM-barrel fold metal-dependent hydrolase